MDRLPLNERPLEHRARNGTVFTASRCDLLGGVTANVPKGLKPEQLAADSAEFGAWHGMCIWPDLRCHFSGYDTIRFTIVELED